MTDIDVTTRTIDLQLEEIAQSVIKRHLDLADPANQDFLRHPDHPEQHQTRWHQWGILTHTRTFLRHFDVDVPGYLRSWKVDDCVDAAMSRPIDGIERRNLLRIAILLHDVGKFAVRYRGRYRFHFTEHEKASGDVVREELHLENFGLTAAQIEYIARTAEDHFVLALVRRKAREQQTYDAAYVESVGFEQLCRSIQGEHSDDYIEVGVLFLGDSLAKSDPQTGPEDARSQYDLNIVVAQRYLQTVCAQPR